MKTSAVTPADLTASIMALPPLARARDGSIAEAENARVIAWLTASGVTTLLYGGVANLFNIGSAEYAALLDMLCRLAPPQCWVVPSIGPDFGRAMDQIAILRAHDFPTAMVLPGGTGSKPGTATGLRRLAEAYGRPLMLFHKSADYLSAEDTGRLLADGVLCCLEYGVASADLANDGYLAEILGVVGTVERIVDGSGERTVVARHAAYGVVGFTSGSGVVGPRVAMALLAALRAGDATRAALLREQFLPLEGLRQKHGPIPVLHDAVALAGIAATGPLGPFFSNVTDPAIRQQIEAAAQKLRGEGVAMEHG